MPNRTAPSQMALRASKSVYATRGKGKGCRAEDRGATFEPEGKSRRAKIRAMTTRLCCTRYERMARQMGWMRVCGIDEVGRGSLFGPVIAAAVVLNPKRR